jgi:uncharacterized protein
MPAARPGAAPRLPRATASALTRELLGPAPDGAALCARLGRDLGLAPEPARRLLYEVVRRVNRDLFPPISMLELILTERCPLRCDYCFEGRWVDRRDMSPEVGRAALDLLFDYSADAGEVWITHFGGEPTLRFALLCELTEYAKRCAAARGQAAHFSLTSNGIGLTPAMAESLAHQGIRVLLSLDGLAETHDRHRVDARGRGTFARVARALRILKATQGWVGAKMTVMPEAAARLVADVQGLHALGVNQFVIGHATGVAWPEASIDAYVAAWRALRDWYAGADRDLLRIDDFEAPGDGAGGGVFGCRAGRVSVAVGADGQISACAKLLARDHRRLVTPLGDVRFGLTHLANRGALVDCDGLRARSAALGVADRYRGCFASNHEATGDPFDPDLAELRFEERVRGALASPALA